MFALILATILGLNPTASASANISGSLEAPPATLAELFAADLTHSGEPWPCSTLDNCVLDCWANAQGSMDCTDGAGLPAAVTPGVGATVEGTPFRPADGTVRRAVVVSSEASSPRIIGLDGSFWAGPHTAIVAGASADTGTRSFFGHGRISGKGVAMDTFASGARCIYTGATVATAQAEPNGSSFVGAHRVAACRFDGSNVRARVNGANSAPSPVTFNASHVPLDPLFFGNAQNIGGVADRPLGGPLAHVRIYSRALSDAELDEYEARMQGTWAHKPGVPVKVARPTPAPCQPDIGGEWFNLGPNWGCVGERGLEIRGPSTNYWPNPTNPHLWTNAGADVVGPDGRGFYTIADDDPTAEEGRLVSSSTTASVTVGDTVTMSCEVEAGTSGIVRFQFSSNGTLSTTTCEHALAADPRRYACSTTLSGAPTFVNFWIKPGVAGPTPTGTVGVRYCQWEKSTAPGAVATCTAPCNRAADVATVATTGWPVARGDVRLNFTPANNGPPAATAYLLDARLDANTGFSTYRHTDGLLYLRLGNGLTTTLWTPSAPTWVAGQTASPFARWGGGSLSVGLPEGPMANSSGGNMPSAIGTTATIGQIWAGGPQYAEGWIKNIRLGDN